MPGYAGTASPFPYVEDVLNLARVRVNDASPSGLGGNLLSDAQPSTLVYLNSAWRWLQTKAGDSGVEDVIDEFNVTGFPLSPDITQQSWIGWGGSGFGGFQSQTPALPANLVLPLNVWWRMTGDLYFDTMTQADVGLPVDGDISVYDWRADGLYFYGTDAAIDLRIRYQKKLDNLQIGGKVPFLYCEDTLSARTAFEFANARGASQAAALAQMSEDSFSMIANRTVRKNQRKSLRRLPYSRRDLISSWPWPTIRNN